MQLYALENEKFVFANHAERQKNYTCIECRQPVRLRGGSHRHKHFFHLTNTRDCFLSKKTMQHLQVQFYIQRMIPACILERPFSEIKRIADAVWKERNIVFEVQCSGISAEEVAKRNSDYREAGYQVVWLLHDMRYNKARFTAAEYWLWKSPHYFTNINAEGEGCIYDQFHMYVNGKRFYGMEALPIKISEPQYLRENVGEGAGFLSNRITHWPLYFAGDLMDCALKGDPEWYLEQAKEFYGRLNRVEEKQSVRDGIKYLVFRYIIRPYLLIFQLLLERTCRK